MAGLGIGGDQYASIWSEMLFATYSILLITCFSIKGPVRYRNIYIPKTIYRALPILLFSYV